MYKISFSVRFFRHWQVVIFLVILHVTLFFFNKISFFLVTLSPFPTMISHFSTRFFHHHQTFSCAYFIFDKSLLKGSGRFLYIPMLTFLWFWFEFEILLNVHIFNQSMYLGIINMMSWCWKVVQILFWVYWKVIDNFLIKYIHIKE